MKLFKSLLLGSAAGLVAVAGASAADLGAKKPAAASFVKECPTYGAGFFVVPGTTSCLKIFGRVRADYLMNDNNNTIIGGEGARAGGSARNTFVARGYFGYDHRTQTEYGLLRTYVQGFLARNNAAAGLNTASGANLEYAFIQFGGLTVGRIAPTFEHGFNFSMDGSGVNGGFSDISSVNSVGYSHSFGGGFKASLNLDAASERRNGVFTQTVVNQASYNGQSLPDAVLALDYTQSWGAIKLAGAVHQVNAHINNVGNKNEYGFAGVLGGKFNLPVMNPGSNLWASATYSQGATSYAGFSSIRSGQVLETAADAIVVNNKLKLTTAYGLAGGVQLFVLPTVFVGLSGNYAVHDAAGPRNTLRFTTARGTVGWVPVAGLRFVGELSYFTVQGNRSQFASGTDKSNWLGRLRVQRDF